MAASVGTAKQEFWMQTEGNTGCVREAGKQPEAAKEKIPTAAKPTEMRDLGNS